jgi:hypothetical protein
MLHQSIQPPGSVSLYHQSFIIDSGVLVWLPSTQDYEYDLKYFVPNGDNGSFESPSDQEPLKKRFELAVRFPGAVGDFTQ